MEFNKILDNMKRTICLMVCLLISVTISAQTQYGVVKTRGRMVGGKLHPGSKLSGATVMLKNCSAVLSSMKGDFSFPVRNNTYILQRVKKQGYQLVDEDVCCEHHYSKDSLYLVMETPEQLRSDQVAAERKIRRNLQHQLAEKEKEIDNMRNISQAEKDSLLRILYQQHSDNERLISDMSKRYSTLDYDQLDEFYRLVSYFIENGELTRADSLLRTRGDINAQVQSILQQGQTIQEQQEVLQKAETVHQVDLEEAARRCYCYYETFLNQHQNDSAAHYLELRAILDTTNVKWQNHAGIFVEGYMADYSKAATFFQRGLRQSLLQYGEIHECTATSYNNIGGVYDSQGDYRKALECYTKSLAIYEKVFGSEHPYVAASYNNIGGVYDNIGNYRQALRYFNKSFVILEKAFGCEHPDVATSFNNIGGVYESQGDYRKSLEFFIKSLAIYEKVFGSEHPDVAQSYNNIGLVYFQQGDYSKALESYTKSLAIREKVFGCEHPDVATSYSNIGGVYDSQGDYPKALEYHTKSLAIREKVFGSEHPDVAQSYNNIGLVYYNQGDYPKALEYFTKSLVIREKVFDFEHPDIATSYSNIGFVYDSQGDYSKALECFTRSLAIYENVFGRKHFNTKTMKSIIKGVKKAMIQK